jgi:hypothetical protein
MAIKNRKEACLCILVFWDRCMCIFHTYERNEEHLVKDVGIDVVHWDAYLFSTLALQKQRTSPDDPFHRLCVFQ